MFFCCFFLINSSGLEACVCSYFSKKSLVWNLIFVVSYFIFLQERNHIHCTCISTRRSMVLDTPQPLYNTIVGVHSINRVS